jgi:hypothetical protein
MRHVTKSRHDVTRNEDNMTKEQLMKNVQDLLEGSATMTMTISAGWRSFDPFKDRTSVTVVFAAESADEEDEVFEVEI